VHLSGVSQDADGPLTQLGQSSFHASRPYQMPRCPCSSPLPPSRAACRRSWNSGTAAGSAARRPCPYRRGVSGPPRADGGTTCTTPARRCSASAACYAVSAGRQLVHHCGATSKGLVCRNHGSGGGFIAIWANRRMRHDGCGSRAGLTGIDGGSRRVRKPAR
jgi:hypothetical protein